jgi:hypothetical protein
MIYGWVSNGGGGGHEDPRAMRSLSERTEQCDLVREQGWYREGVATLCMRVLDLFGYCQ